MSQSLHEAIMQVALGEKNYKNYPTPTYDKKTGKKIESDKKPKTTYGEKTEELVYEYLSSFFGVDLNESVDDLTEEDFENAVSAINVLRNAVNEYFELDEAFKPYPKIDKLPDGHVRTDHSGPGITTSSWVNPKNDRTEVIHHGPEDVVRKHEEGVAKSVLRSAGPRVNNRRRY